MRSTPEARRIILEAIQQHGQPMVQFKATEVLGKACIVTLVKGQPVIYVGDLFTTADRRALDAIARAYEPTPMDRMIARARQEDDETLMESILALAGETDKASRMTSAAMIQVYEERHGAEAAELLMTILDAAGAEQTTTN